MNSSFTNFRFQTAKHEFEVFTYNMSTTYLVDEEDTEVEELYVNYNWKDVADDFCEGCTNFDNLLITCGAQGGRPEPTIRWYINTIGHNGVSFCKDLSKGRPLGREISLMRPNRAPRIHSTPDQLLSLAPYLLVGDILSVSGTANKAYFGQVLIMPLLIESVTKSLILNFGQHQE